MNTVLPLKISAILLLSACLLPSQANADFVSANRLLTACQSKLDNPAREVCAGYILGISDLLQALTRAKIINGYCPPFGVTVGQMMLIVRKYLKDHPADLHTSAAGNVFIPLINAFPCKK